MSYKWGHPVATLPVTNGTIRHIRRMTEILRITSPSSAQAPPTSRLVKRNTCDTCEPPYKRNILGRIRAGACGLARACYEGALASVCTCVRVWAGIRRVPVRTFALHRLLAPRV
eukprot:6212196-Pleurochrysis_carterae.AAC.2